MLRADETLVREAQNWRLLGADVQLSIRSPGPYE